MGSCIQVNNRVFESFFEPNHQKKIKAKSSDINNEANTEIIDINKQPKAQKRDDRNQEIYKTGRMKQQYNESVIQNQQPNNSFNEQQIDHVFNRQNIDYKNNLLAIQNLLPQMRQEQISHEQRKKESQNEQKLIFQNLRKLKQKYKHSKIISTYLNLEKSSGFNDFFRVDLTLEQTQAFKKQRILGCRVIILLIILATQAKHSKIKHNSEQLEKILKGNQFKEVKKYFRAHNIQYSVRQYPWKVLQNQNQNQRQSKYFSMYESTEAINKKEYTRILEDQQKKIKAISSKSQLFECIDKFLQTIGLNPYQAKAEPTSLLKGLISLSGQEYKMRYVLDIAQVGYQNVNNLKFYSGNIFIRHNNMSIKDLHKKHKQYEWLEHTHDYIQWMFPNHYHSSFNGSSQALSYSQAQAFQKDFKLGELMFRSIQIYLDFAGISISKKLQLQMINRNRLRGVLIQYTHNHLRIMRILACLSVTGFRIVALNFISFLQFVVNNDKGFTNIKDTFERDWKVYDDLAIDSSGSQSKQSDLEKAKQMCFMADQYFPQMNPYLRAIYREKTEQQDKNKCQIGSIRRQQSGFYNQKDISCFISKKQEKKNILNKISSLLGCDKLSNDEYSQSAQQKAKLVQTIMSEQIPKNQILQENDLFQQKNSFSGQKIIKKMNITRPDKFIGNFN